MNQRKDDDGYVTFLRLGLGGVVTQAEGRDMTDDEIAQYELYEHSLKLYLTYQSVAHLPHWNVPKKTRVNYADVLRAAKERS